MQYFSVTDPCSIVGCSDTCTHVDGIAQCSCPQNFLLMPDQKTCRKFDPVTGMRLEELGKGLRLSYTVEGEGVLHSPLMIAPTLQLLIMHLKLY